MRSKDVEKVKTLKADFTGILIQAQESGGATKCEVKLEGMFNLPFIQKHKWTRHVENHSHKQM